jgi:hypothetical protein
MGDDEVVLNLDATVRRMLMHTQSNEDLHVFHETRYKTIYV